MHAVECGLSPLIERADEQHVDVLRNMLWDARQTGRVSNGHDVSNLNAQLSQGKRIVCAVIPHRVTAKAIKCACLKPR